MRDDTTGQQTYCIHSKFVKMRFLIYDFDWLPKDYRWSVTLNIAEFERKKRINKLNAKMGNCDLCKCPECNPDTST